MELDIIDTRRPIQKTDYAERMQRLKRRKKRRRKKLIVCSVFIIGILAVLAGIIFFAFQMIEVLFRGRGDALSEEERAFIAANHAEKPVMTEAFLTQNPYSRPGIELPEVNSIFVHYTANQGTSASQNRSYFENLGITHETSASAHFIIGLEGEIIQCIPLEEIGYAVKKRNYDSVSIECCYEKENGEFNEATYESLICLCAWLMNEYDLTIEDVLRHYDAGGKKCPLYYVENEEEWQQLLNDLKQYVLKERGMATRAFSFAR